MGSERTTRFTVNGEEREVTVPGHTTLAQALRGTLNLTGLQIGCDKGDCGACTVVVDGHPVLSCIALCGEYDGSAIQTIEGLGHTEDGDRLQESLGKYGGSQCGACTSGVLNALAVYLQETSDPTRQGFKEACAGNICRCTGYQQIFDAACDAAGLPTPELPVSSRPLVTIGRPATHPSTRKKLDGSGQYAADNIPDNAAWLQLVMSPHPRATIEHIPVEVAEALPGVLLVIVGADIPSAYCLLPHTPQETVLAMGKAHYVGRPVAAVVAETREQADHAARLLGHAITYTVHEHVLEAIQAMGPGAPVVYDVDPRGRPVENNIFTRAVIPERGDVEAGFDASDTIVEEQFHFAGSTHAAIEPHAVWADWDEEKQAVKVVSSTQVSKYLQERLTMVLGFLVYVIRMLVGGGFGGKSDVFPPEFLTAYAAHKLKRPVAFVATREQVFVFHRGRHPITFDVKLGMSSTGKVLATDMKAYLNGGAEWSYGLVTAYYAGTLAPVAVNMEAYRFEGYRVATNTAPCGPKRGHGSVQAIFAIMRAVAIAAERLGLDPADVLEMNSLASGEKFITGYRVPSSGMRECITAVREASGWDTLRNNLPKGRGMGIATSAYISGTHGAINGDEGNVQSVVHVEAVPGGYLRVYTGAEEMGQDSDIAMARFVAEATGVPLDHVLVKSGDTWTCPPDNGGYSSRQTRMTGKAAQEAGENFREWMIRAIEARWLLPKGSVIFDRGEFQTEVIGEARVRRGHEQPSRWTGLEALELVTKMIPGTRATGIYTTQVGILDPEDADIRGIQIGLSPSYSQTAHVVEVEVDTETGIVTIVKIWVAHDCGQAINPVAAVGQINGSVIMGANEALMEDMAYDPETGLHVGPDLLNYPLFTSLDAPDIHTILVEEPDPCGPHGAKEVGEGPLHPIIPALAMAIEQACGARLLRTPFTPERVLKAIKEAQEKKGAQ